MKLSENDFKNYTAILREELIPAMGCTEPIAIAYAAAMTRKLLGEMPIRITVNCSGNIIKNVKGVTVPNSGGQKGIEVAAILGMVGGDPDKKLEVIAGVTDEDREECRRLNETKICDVNLSEDVPNLYIEIIMESEEHTACVRIAYHHTDIVYMSKNQEIALVYVLFIASLVAPTNGLLRNPETHSFLSSPFMSGIIFFMMLLFLLPGLAYGIGAGSIKNDKDMIALMNKTISGLSSFMVLIFFAAQFTACFNYSNLGTIISVSGADFLKSVGFTGLPLIICFIVLTAFINIFIAVDSAKWAIMAPIFVPMFMRLGLSPELTQCAYRIGDSATNIIAPLMPFFVLTVAFFQKYDKKVGIGSVISTMLPYSICFLLGWLVMFSVWYLLGLPLGPGSPMFY